METGLFPGYRGERKNLRMATPVILAYKVWHHIGNHIKQRNTHLYAIWDAFSGLGVDAVAAAKTLQTVVFATEKDPATYALLQQNITTHDPRGLVIARCADAFQNPFRCDLIYLDPPWEDAFHPSEPYDFFDRFQVLFAFMKPWARFLVIKTPLLIGPTEPPWPPAYAYRSKKYRIIFWLFDLQNHATGIHPFETIDEEDGGDEHEDGGPCGGQMTAQESFTRTLHNQPE